MEPMVYFSQVYEKTRTTIARKKWHVTIHNGRNIDWQHELKTHCCMQLMLAYRHLDSAHEQALARLRNTLNDEAIYSRSSVGELIDSVNKAAENKQRLPSLYAFNLSRAGALKMLYHLYFLRRRGAQGLWVYSPPLSNQSWVYDALKQNRADTVRKLNAKDEYFSYEQRETISKASEMAMQWCADAQGASNIMKEATGHQWFIGDDARAKKSFKRAILQKITIGLQKMINLLNSNTLIFSYHPDLGGNTNLPAGVAGFIYPYEKMDVVYIKNNFTARDGKSAQWHCAVTIIHEVSHRVLGTKDHSYAWQGLRPGNTGLSSRQAFDNADTWAHFIADMTFNLTDAQRSKYLVPKHR